jgi:DNA-directed RNA polymerase subunit K/omega
MLGRGSRFARNGREQQVRSEVLNEELLERAKGTVADVRLLINGASRRAAELARGGRPLIPLTPGSEPDYLDIALMEIAEGKVVIAPPSEEAPEE